MLLGFTGSNLGLMWGTFFSEQNSSILSSLMMVILSSMGGGKFINLNSKSKIIKYFGLLSPIKYSTEKFFRRLVSMNDGYGLTYLILGFKSGDFKCTMALLITSISFFIIGWLSMIYKSRRL